MYRLACLAILVVGVGPTPLSVRASRHPGPHVATITHHIKLSVSTARARYPRDALIRATLRIQNLSRHSVRLAAFCPSGYLQAQVTTGAEAILYPPLFKPGYGPVIRCKFVRPFVLPPDHVLSEKQYVILRGPRLQVGVDLVTNESPVVLESRPLVLRLRKGTPPAVTLSTTPGLRAEVRVSTFRQRGRLLYQEAEWCPSAKGSDMIGGGYATVRWETLPPRPQYSFEPSCATPLQWHVLAGWLNQPVASIDYSRAPPK